MQRDILVAGSIGAVLGALMSTAIGWWHTNSVAQDLYSEIRQRPPLVVLDLAKAAEQSFHLDDDGRKKTLQNTKDLISRYVDDGALVLDRNAVIGAPRDMYISTGGTEEQADKP